MVIRTLVVLCCLILTALSDETTSGSTDVRSSIDAPTFFLNDDAEGGATVGQPQPILPEVLKNLQFKPETKEEIFARLDADGDEHITLEDYMKRDRFYVEALKAEFDQIDENDDQKVSKTEFEDYIRKLEEQHKETIMRASNFTLNRHDYDGDGSLNEPELASYINVTLQRDVINLPDVFKQFDENADGLLDLKEFHALDFNFPWDKFPLSESAIRAALHSQPLPMAPPQLGGFAPGAPPGFAPSFI